MDLVFVPAITTATITASDGREYEQRTSTSMLAIQKIGRVLRQETEEVLLDLTDRVCADNERGMLSAALHPNFGRANPWLYLYYSRKPSSGLCVQDARNGPSDRVSRFEIIVTDVANSDSRISINPSSEVVLMQTPPQEQSTHNGGDLKFGLDGYLYISIGDGGTRPNYEAQKLHRLLGKLVRLTDDGNVPADNPFRGAANAVSCKTTGDAPQRNQVCEEIFSYGFRNPFRMAVNPVSPTGVLGDTQIFISDVGRGTWEEVNEAGTRFAGANYGWMLREGPCDFGSYDQGCDLETDVLAQNFQDPIHFYNHRLRADRGAAVIGGVFPPVGVWSHLPNDAYIVSDFVMGEIFIITPDPSGGCRSCLPPVTPWRNETLMKLWDGDEDQDIPGERPVTLKFGPCEGTNTELGYESQCLYYTCVRCKGNIRRIAYIGGNNASPTAVLSVSPEVSRSGGTIFTVDTVFQFDASESIDPEGGPISYLWEFTGGYTSTEEAVSHQFDSTGPKLVTLTVTDDAGFQDVSRLEIRVGAPPRVVIQEPRNGDMFQVGQILTLKGMAFDSNQEMMDDDQLIWEVRQHHNSHYHPFLIPTQGNLISVGPAPRPEDLLAATDSYLEVLLTVHDPITKVSTTASTIVEPEIVYITLATDPPFLRLVVDGESIVTPRPAAFWVGERLRISARGNANFAFDHWSGSERLTGIGASQTEFSVRSHDNNSVIQANFVAKEAVKVPTMAMVLSQQEYITIGFPIIRDGVILHLEPDGNVALFDQSTGKLVWESNTHGTGSSYYGMLQNDCDLVVKEGHVGSTEGQILWNTNTQREERPITTFPNALCFLAVFPFEERVALMDAIGETYWEDRIDFPITPPTAEPTKEPTQAPTPSPIAPPTAEPTKEPTQAPTPSPTPPEPTSRPIPWPTSQPTPGEVLRPATGIKTRRPTLVVPTLSPTASYVTVVATMGEPVPPTPSPTNSYVTVVTTMAEPSPTVPLSPSASSTLSSDDGNVLVTVINIANRSSGTLLMKSRESFTSFLSVLTALTSGFLLYHSW